VRLAALCLTLFFGSALFGETPELTSTKLQNPQEIINRSLDYAKSHDAFHDLFFFEHEDEFVRLVKEGQSPRTLVISCSDSRVTPEFIVTAKPGDFFVVRNAGNFVPVYDTKLAWDGIAASIEYAVQVVGVKDVIVCGHSQCGAIQALFYDQDKLKTDLPVVQKWLQWGELAKKITQTAFGKDMTKADMYAAAERLSVVYQLEHLLTFPYIKKAVEDKKLYLHGWHFNIEKGEITYFNPKTCHFMPLRGLLEK
jgi:carbonic anhydrase